MPIHCMRLNLAPFGRIRDGRKCIELRLYDGKRRNIQIGDGILFENTKAPELLPPGDGAPGLCLLGRSVSSPGPGGLRLSLLKLASAGPADMEVCCSKEAQQRVACFLEEQVV